MLAHPTLEQLHALGLHGMAKGFKELEHNPEVRGLDHAEWLVLILEYETTLRRQKRFETRTRATRLRHPASVEDVDYQSPRGLDRALLLKLAACDWLAERRNLPIAGASGLGKSWLACALGQKACRQDVSVLYYRSYYRSRGSSPIWPWRVAMGVTVSSCARSPAPSCSSSTTGDRNRSPQTRRAAFSKLSRIVTTPALS